MDRKEGSAPRPRPGQAAYIHSGKMVHMNAQNKWQEMSDATTGHVGVIPLGKIRPWYWRRNAWPTQALITAMPNGSSFTSYGWAVCLWALVIAFQVYLPLYIAILADFLQYGYHISVLNQIQGVLTCKVTTPHTFPATPRLADCIPMSDLTFSLLTAIFTIGGLAGSLVANLVMDSSGRRGSNRICAIFMAVGTALMGLSNSLILLLLGR